MSRAGQRGSGALRTSALWIAFLVLAWVLPLGAEVASDALSLPRGKGLPVSVRVGIFFLDIRSFDDNAGTFEAVTDLRLTWEDPRLRYPASEALNGYKEFRCDAAERELAGIWTPRLVFPNRKGEPSSGERRLRLFPNGQVEVMARTTATYEAAVDVTRFPFDQQVLALQVAVREDTVESVNLEFTNEDVRFSRVSNTADLRDWQPGLVSLSREIFAGWNGDRYARVEGALSVQRRARSTIATIFLPLFASLLIPFLVIWMNKVDGDGFEVDAFELANFVIGGLFAVIALSFTINSGYPAIAATDNTVTRLVGLNYLSLAMALILVIVFYRYKLPARWFGTCIQEQAFLFLTWAFPLVVLATGFAFLLAAAA